jgi:hypothetical protein
LNAEDIVVIIEHRSVRIITNSFREVFINQLCHPEWDNVLADDVYRITLYGFHCVRNDTKKWGDPYCLKWFREKFGDKFSTDELVMMERDEDNKVHPVVDL